MKAFQKQVEAHLTQAFTGLVVSTLPAIFRPGTVFQRWPYEPQPQGRRLRFCL